MRAWPRSPVLATLLAALVACGETDPRQLPPPADSPLNGERPSAEAPDSAPPNSESTRPEGPASEPATAGADPVWVWFTRGESLVPVARPDAGDSLPGALHALLAGPTAAERSRGLDSWFGDGTRGLLKGVEREGGRAVVDFQGSLPSAIPGAGSSAGSEVLLAALDSTVFQFPWIKTVEYRLEGSCAAFWEWLQRECVVVTRP